MSERRAPRRVLAAPDKFKGTATAGEVAAAIGHACWEAGIDCVEIPMADGGDGILDILGGGNRRSTVTGPLGDPVVADWRFADGTAVIEIARASGLVLTGGAEANDPLAATTTGTGELIDHALDSGARRIIVGLGGSATTDGGFGAIRAINGIARLKQVELLVACDVTTPFVDAATVFAPQKGATPAQVKMLERRLQRLVQMFADDFDTDVTTVEGGGAAGGLGGALAALGGRLVPGFELIGDEVGLFEAVEEPDGAPFDMIITGEGGLDDTSLDGKVVGGVLELADEHDIAVGIVAGRAEPSMVTTLGSRAEVVTLVDQVGVDAAMSEPKQHIEAAARRLIERLGV